MPIAEGLALGQAGGCEGIEDFETWRLGVFVGQGHPMR